MSDDYDEPEFEDCLRGLVIDAIFDGLTVEEFLGMALAEWNEQAACIKAARNAPPPPPVPFITLHSRNWLTGEAEPDIIVMQDRPDG